MLKYLKLLSDNFMKSGKPFEKNDHNWVILLEMIQNCYISLPNVMSFHTY